MLFAKIRHAFCYFTNTAREYLRISLYIHAQEIVTDVSFWQYNGENWRKQLNSALKTRCPCRLCVMASALLCSYTKSSCQLCHYYGNCMHVDIRSNKMEHIKFEQLTFHMITLINLSNVHVERKSPQHLKNRWMNTEHMHSC